MEGPRPPIESEFPSVIKFLDSELRSEQGWSITSEYPVAFSENNRNNIRIITEHDQVLAHAVIRPMIIKAPAGLFKIAGVGSVVTSSDHRNQGLSSKTIESCLSAARSHGCDVAILWTNIYEFYRKFGFELAGTELSVLLDRDLKIADTNLKILEGNRVSPEAIHRLYSLHTVTSIRTIEETRKYLQIPNSRVYTAWDAAGQLKAYAVEGKGADLNGYVHEWGGGVGALLALFQHIRKTQARDLGRNITIIVPRHSQNLIRQFNEQNIAINEGFLGMIKILNHANFFAKIKRYARNMGIADFVLEERAGTFYIGTKDRVFTTESEHEIVRLIFGPQAASKMHDFGQDAQLLEKILPIDMWVWGWDSI